MPDDRWERMWELFHQALERPPADRAAFLDDACARDTALRREIDELLASREEGSSLPGGESLLGLLGAQAAAAAGPEAALDTTIGPYRLERVLGEGGMGVVYAALQESPIRRRVALKLIRFGLGSAGLLARFQAERQILAMMDHPNIAAIHEAGLTSTGLPYFVMELVDGVPITAYADQARLTTRERLELLLPVCRAVQHAHQKGVIHRDLKPSNLLVGSAEGSPHVKVIDFGIAKVVAPLEQAAAQLTAHGGPVGTPEYMSPEQSEKPHDVDTRTDVYSLGILLYELLAGAPPRAEPATGRPAAHPSPSSRVRSLGAGAGALAAMRRTEPTALRRQLRGELDWIVLKAIEPDRQRRYQSVSDLGTDIERCLVRQPVAAGPPGAIYRARTFVRRHRLGVAAATVIGALLIGSAIVTTVLSLRLSRALADARRELARSERVSSLMVDIFQLPDPYRGQGRTVSARALLDAQARLVKEDLNDQPEVQAAMLDTLGRVYQHLGDYDQAGPLFKQALEMRLALLGAEHQDAAASQFNLGVYHLHRHEYAAAEPLLQAALESRRRSLGPEHPLTAMSLRALGTLKSDQGQLDVAETLLRETLAITRKSIGSGAAPDPEVFTSLALVVQKKGQFDEAARLYEEALAATPERNGLTRSRILGALGTLRFDRGEYPQSVQAFREALAIEKERLGAEHPTVAYRLGNLGLSVHHVGDYAEAERLYGESIALARRALGEKHGLVATQLNNLALLAQDREDDATAERLFREAMEMRVSLVGPEHPDVAFHMSNLARVLHHEGRLEEAEGLYRRAIEIRGKTLPAKHPLIAMTSTWLGMLVLERGDPGAAEPVLRDAVEVMRGGLPAEDWRTAEAESHLGGCLAKQRRFEEAEPLVLEGYEGLDRKRGSSFWRTRAALDRVIDLYDAWGRQEEAATWRARRAQGAEAGSQAAKSAPGA